MPAEWRISEYLENSASSKYYSQVKELLNRGARACPGLLLVRLEWAWCCFLPEKPVLLFTQTKTKLILVTARGKTSEADLSPIQPVLFFQPQWELKSKGEEICLSRDIFYWRSKKSNAPDSPSGKISWTCWSWGFVPNQHPLEKPRHRGPARPGQVTWKATCNTEFMFVCDAAHPKLFPFALQQ